MFIKLTDKSAVAISVYPNEEEGINSKNLAESHVSGELNIFLRKILDYLVTW